MNAWRLHYSEMFVVCVWCQAEQHPVTGSQTTSVSAVSLQDSHPSAISSSKQSSSAAVSDNASGSPVRLLLLSHSICTFDWLYSLRDFWRHFGLCTAAAHSDCCFFVPCTNILTYLLTYSKLSPQKFLFLPWGVHLPPLHSPGYAYGSVCRCNLDCINWHFDGFFPLLCEFCL